MQRLNEDIKSGQLKKVYLLYGEEAYLRKQYKDRLKAALVGDDTMNYHYFEGKNIAVGEVIDLAETLPFFAEKRLIVIENSGLFKSGGEQLSEYLAGQAETTFFVFVESEVDKRSKLYKAVQSKGSAVEFGEQDETTLKRWILGMMKKEGKNISPSALQYLLEKTDITECQNSLDVSSKILNEIKQKHPLDFGNNLYRIYLTGTVSTDFSLNITQIESILNQELSYAKIYDNTDTDFSNIKAIANESSLRGIFVQKMLEMTENAGSENLDAYNKALKLGLKAFEKEVLWGDN